MKSSIKEKKKPAIFANPKYQDTLQLVIIPKLSEQKSKLNLCEMLLPVSLNMHLTSPVRRSLLFLFT